MGLGRRVVAIAVAVLVGPVGAVHADAGSVRADTEPPVVRVTAPVDRTAVGSPVLLAGTVRDDDAVAAVRLRLRRDDGRWFDGTKWRAAKVTFRARLADPGGERSDWTRRVPLTSGRRYVLTAVAVDSAGNRSDPVVRRFRGAPPPDLAVDLDGTLTDVGSIDLVMTVGNTGGATARETEVRLDAIPGVQTIQLTEIDDAWTCELESDIVFTCRTDELIGRGDGASLRVLVWPGPDMALMGISLTASVRTQGEVATADNSDSSFFMPPPMPFAVGAR